METVKDKWFPRLGRRTDRQSSEGLWAVKTHSVVTKSCPALRNPVDGSTPGSPVLHHLPGLAQTHVH